MMRLEKMLRYVSEHNDFYKNRIREYGITNPLDITQWPVLTRKELQANRYNMFSDGYKSKYFNQQLRRQASSGSTGMPVNVYWDYRDWYASNLCLWRKRQKWYGIKPSDKCVMFTLNSFGIQGSDQIFHINATRNILSINVSLITRDSSFSKVEKILDEYCPKWLLIQPFVLDKLIRSYQNNQTSPPPSVSYVETLGGPLPSDIRRKARSLFHCNVTNMYGSEETNAIAFENPKQEMIVLKDNVFIEVKSENDFEQQNSAGNIIMTSLHNYAMPLIRYCLNDFVKISDKCNKEIIDCVCGRVSQALPIGDYFISDFFLMEIIAETNNRFGDPIEEYFFEFLSKNNSLRCYICLGNIQHNQYEAIKLFMEELFHKKTVLPSCIEFSVLQCNQTPQITQINRKKQILFVR